MASSRQSFRIERHMFSTSDETTMLNQIRATHAPDGREVDVKIILSVVEDIFNRVAPSISGAIQGVPASSDVVDDKVLQAGYSDIMDLLAYTINKISCEMSCKCTGSGDAHATTLVLFSTLSSYSWDAKVVLALAAFAVSYGEFWLVAQLYLTNPLAKSVSILKQIPETMEHFESLRPRYDAIVNLIKAILNVTNCIIQLKELPSQYISHDMPEYETAISLVPTASYWTIRSIVACASQIMGLVGVSHEYVSSTTEAWELSSLAHKVNSIFEHLTKQLALCHQHIDEKKQMEAYQMLVHLFETPHIDNSKVLKALIHSTDDQPPLLEGVTKQRVSTDVLRRKSVLLLISDLDISSEEIAILYQIYQGSRENPSRPDIQYEVVWIPVVDRAVPWDETKPEFEALRSMMFWNSVYHPSMVDQAAIKYIKEVWHFSKKPLLVVLDPLGRVVNPNAIHMLWIWESQAFPFTSAREEALWREESSWRLELLADTVEPQIFTWINENRCICLYGGEDMEWIRKFTSEARKAAQEVGSPLEMLYVGKSNPKDRVRKINSTISSEGLSHILPDVNLIWFFWVRLESMWHSKMQHGRTVENDPITQEIVTMLSYDGSDHGWAVFFRGSTEMARAKGEAMVECFDQFEEWKADAETKGLVQALKECLERLHTPHHCNRLILPGTAGDVPESVVCAECGTQMEKFIMYRCCTE